MDEDQIPEAIKIAEKYDKEYVTGSDKYVSGPNNYIKIYLNEEDWDKGYFDPRVKTKKDLRK